ncbi:MAG: hypothetical protein ACI90V_012271, partial [Bacillariaceae sp.]
LYNIKVEFDRLIVENFSVVNEFVVSSSSCAT